MNHILLPNDSHPLSAGMETSVFESIKHTFRKLARRRKMAADLISAREAMMQLWMKEVLPAELSKALTFQHINY